MLKSKKLTIGIIVCALMALCLTLFDLTSTNTNKVALADTGSASINVRVDYYKYGLGNGTPDPLYTKNNVLATDLGYVRTELSSYMWNYWHKPLADLKITIDLNGDFAGEMSSFSLICGEIVLNLNGHTLTMNDEYSWLSGCFTINGGGKIIVSESTTQDRFPYGVIYVAGMLNATNVTFENAKTNSAYPMFFVADDWTVRNNANVTLNRCTFKNCSSNGNGGAIECENGVKAVTIEYCTFENCTAKGNSGAIKCNAGVESLEVKHCTFKNCTANGNGGAIECNSDVKNFEVNGCTFENCSAKNGGAIYYVNNSNEDNDLYITGQCVFKNCTATEFGGAIYMDSNTSFALVTYGALFENCSAKNGGAIAIFSTSSKQFLVMLSGTKITGCSATENGGGVYVKGPWISFSGGEICYCTAKYGAGIYAKDTDNPSCGNNMTIHNCTASILGGAYYAPSDSHIIITNSQCYDNTPASSGYNYASVISSGSVIIISVVAGIAIATAGVFMTLYFKARKKTGTEG